MRNPGDELERRWRVPAGDLFSDVAPAVREAVPIWPPWGHVSHAETLAVSLWAWVVAGALGMCFCAWLAHTLGQMALRVGSGGQL